MVSQICSSTVWNSISGGNTNECWYINVKAGSQDGQREERVRSTYLNDAIADKRNKSARHTKITNGSEVQATHTRMHIYTVTERL